MQSFQGIAIIGILAMALGYSCGRGGGSDFDFSILEGRWASSDTISSQCEEWLMVNDTTLVGKGYVLEGGDTTFIESLEIRKVKGVWTYFAKVEQLNGGEVIPFRLSKQSDRRVEFVNSSHDFPKKIGYEFIGENELQAYIEGPRSGQNIRILFEFKKEN
jgi:hypothetical protein